jgi:geranylgeranyl diphosphate synthase type II
MSSETSEEVLQSALSRERESIECRLGELLSDLEDAPDTLREAMRYSLLDGGKRLRPILCLWAHDLLEGSSREACLDVACAIEVLHTYTLIHDDLPCMDDDDLRRGRPSSHKRFGEAAAILAGDALLTMCFSIIAGITGRWGVSADTAVEIAAIIARAGGAEGVVGGQVLDLEGERLQVDIERVREIHLKKTAALIAAAVECGAVMGGADRALRERARMIGLQAGEAFQIIDDLLDIEVDTATLGKKSGKDEAQGKQTYPAAVGRERARERAGELILEAKRGLRSLGDDPRLEALLDFILARRS